MAEGRKNPAAKKAAPDTPDPEPVVTEAEATEQAASNGTAKTKAPSLYHVYTTDDEGKTLNWIADRMVKTGDVAVAELVAADEGLVGTEIVVVPDRNYKVYSTEVETKTKVKVTAA